MWSSDSDLELLDMLSDWSDLSSDEDSKESFERALDYTSALDKNAPDVPDDMSLYDEDDAPSLSRDSQCKGEESLFNEFQCNVCNKTITDFRYTCVQCSDLDLCGACEANRAHHHHYVLRIPAPRPFTEVQFVLATIRRHLMKRLDPIKEPGQERDDVISVKSEIKVEFESNDGFENNEDENNGDDENSDDENTDDDGSSDDHDDHNDNSRNNEETNENSNIVDVDIVNTAPSEDTLHRSEATADVESEALDTRHNHESVIFIKEEPESECVQEQLGAQTEASSVMSTEARPALSTEASTTASHASSTGANTVAPPPVAAKRKIVIKRSDIINVKDFAPPAKMMCVEPISSHAANDAEETVTLVFPDDQPPQLQPPETGQELKMEINASRCKASAVQLSYLAEYMKSHSYMTSSINRPLQVRANLEILWENLAKKLNSLGGPIRTVSKWKQTWRDLRNNVKKKESFIKKEYSMYGSSSTCNRLPAIRKLSQVEELVLSIMGSVTVHGMEEVACTEKLTPSPAEPAMLDSSLPAVPGPSNKHAPSLKRQRRPVKKHESFDNKLLRIEEEKLKLEKENNEIFNRMVNVLEDSANKL